MSRSEPEPTASSTDNLSSVADPVRQLVNRLLHDGAAVTVDVADLRSLISSVARLYAACSDKAGYEIPAVDETVSPTDAVALACALIRAHNLNPFDLAIWYSRGVATQPAGLLNGNTREGLS